MSITADTEASRAPSFPTLENEIEGLVANARISFSLTTVARAAEHGEWSRAVDSLEKLAEKMGGFGAPIEAWRELLSAAAWYGVRASDIAMITPIFEGFAGRAWAADSCGSMPWDLQLALGEADRRGRFDAGRDLGVLVEALFPSCPLGSYAAAHFTERKHQIHGKAIDAAAVAQKFEQAAQLADSLGMSATAERARLRAGALLLRTGTSREHGRELLRGVDPDHFGRADTLWYAAGMAHSPFWLDRVRAADAVLAIAEADKEPQRDTTDAASYLLDCAPIELQPLEVDRLEALADELDGVSGTLGLRSHLQGVASAPATQAGDAADILAQSSGDDADDAQRAQVAFCRAVGDLFEDGADADLDKEVISRIAKVFPVAAAVLEALAPTVAGDPRKLATALGDLERLFRQRGHAFGASDLKPVALLWPKLLELVREIKEDDDIDATTVSRIRASLTEVLTRWLPDAPTPGYGWWGLAANLLASDLADQAAIAARRAIDDGESVDPAVEQRVIAAVLDQTIRDRSEKEMLEWLELAERRFG